MSASLKITTPSDREIEMTRVFDAPRKLVFEAWTTPALLKRWLLGPGDWTMPLCEVDLRVGGNYRFVWRHPSDGREMGLSGVYREIAAPARLVSTEKFDEAWYPGEAVVTLLLTEQAGRTTSTTLIRYDSQAARDIALQSGMKDGVSESYDRLEALLAPQTAA